MAIDTDNTSSTFDIGAMVTAEAEKVDFGGGEEDAPDDTAQIDDSSTETTETTETDENTPQTDDDTTEQTEETQQATVRPAPKSWAKEQHEVWSKMPKEAQDYVETREKQMLDGIEEYKEFAGFGRELNNVIAPYNPMFEKAGIDYKTGVQYLLNAQYLLQEGTQQQKTNELRRIAQQYGVNLGVVGDPAQNNQENQQQAIDPNIKLLQDEVNALKGKISRGEQHTLTEAKARAMGEVEAFVNDGSHPYFEEVADEIVIFLEASRKNGKAGMTLEQAYDKAVYANDVTRAKEIARINTESDAKLKAKRLTDIELAKKAKGSNVRTIDTTKTPTEAKGKLFSKEYEAEMKSIVDKHFS